MLSESDTAVRDNILKWCKEDKIPCVAVPDNPTITFGFKIGNSSIYIYKSSQFPDRIFIESVINIAPEHKTLINETWDNGKKNGMILQLKGMAIQLGFNIIVGTIDKDKITDVKSNNIHFHTSIKKAEFLEKFLRIGNIHDHVLNQLSILLQTEVQNIQAQQALQSNASDVGIQ
jgi:hypothetical protein